MHDTGLYVLLVLLVLGLVVFVAAVIGILCALWKDFVSEDE